MRRGNEASVLKDSSGRWLAIATGSDYCAEHEHGAQALLAELTGFVSQYPGEVAAEIKRDPQASIPQLIESRRIKENLGHVVFMDFIEGGENAAVMGFNVNQHDTDANWLRSSELRWFGARQDRELIGAWDSRSFGFRTQGKESVERLREFHKALLDGECGFVGFFLEKTDGPRMTGVVLGRTNLLAKNHKKAIQEAQRKFEQKVRLEVLSRASELMVVSREQGQPKHKRGGHIWAAWKDGQPDSEVVYWVNPAYGCKDPNRALSYEEMAAWLQGRAVATA